MSYGIWVTTGGTGWWTDKGFDSIEEALFTLNRRVKVHPSARIREQIGERWVFLINDRPVTVAGTIDDAAALGLDEAAIYQGKITATVLAALCVQHALPLDVDGPCCDVRYADASTRTLVR